MDGERHAEVLGGGEDRVVVGVAERGARMGERGDVAALGSLADGPLQLVSGGDGVGERQVGGGDQPGRIGAELADPAVVGLGVGLRKGRILNLGLPQQPNRGVKDGGVDVLGVEHFETFAGVHCAVGRFTEIGPLRVLLEGPEIRVAHRSQRRRESSTAELRWLPVDLQLLEAVLVDRRSATPVAELRIDVVDP